MDTRAIWQYDPISSAWSLYLVRSTSLGFEIAVRRDDGRVDWERRDPAVRTDDPPLIRIDDWILRDVVLPAAPGAAKPEQALGRVEALAEALQVERGRVDTVLGALLEGQGR